MQDLTKLFPIPFVHLRIDDWEEKKPVILKVLSDCLFARKDDEFVDHDFYRPSHTYPYWNDIKDLLLPTFAKFADIMGNDIHIKSYWTEKAKRGDTHLVHNHGALGYSSVLYVDYDENEHTPTRLIAPYLSFEQGSQITYDPPDVKSGSIIFFPSQLLHYTLPNNSNKERLIMSFNIGISRVLQPAL